MCYSYEAAREPLRSHTRKQCGEAERKQCGEVEWGPVINLSEPILRVPLKIIKKIYYHLLISNAGSAPRPFGITNPCPKGRGCVFPLTSQKFIVAIQRCQGSSASLPPNVELHRRNSSGSARCRAAAVGRDRSQNGGFLGRGKNPPFWEKEFT